MLTLFYRRNKINKVSFHNYNCAWAQQRVQCLAGGNPVWKGLTNPPVASLGCVLATVCAKRRQQGDRVIRHFSPEILVNQCGDILLTMESNIAAFVSGKNVADIAGSEVSHVIQWHCINWGETAFPSSPQKGTNV